MSTHTVQIGDDQGNLFKISVTREFAGPGGSWRVLDQGYLSVTSGAVQVWRDDYDPLHASMYLFGPDNNSGMVLNDYETFALLILVNDQGTGVVGQPWVLALHPGRISWALAD